MDPSQSSMRYLVKTLVSRIERRQTAPSERKEFYNELRSNFIKQPSIIIVKHSGSFSSSYT